MKINICVTFNEGRSLWKSLGKWPSSMESNIYANMHLASSLGFCSTCPLLILLLHRPSLLSVCPFSVLGLCLCVTGVPLCPCSVCVSVCYCWRNTDVSARLPGWPTVSQTHLCSLWISYALLFWHKLGVVSPQKIQLRNVFEENFKKNPMLGALILLLCISNVWTLVVYLILVITTDKYDYCWEA